MQQQVRGTCKQIQVSSDLYRRQHACVQSSESYIDDTRYCQRTREQSGDREEGIRDQNRGRELGFCRNLRFQLTAAEYLHVIQLGAAQPPGGRSGTLCYRCCCSVQHCSAHPPGHRGPCSFKSSVQLFRARPPPSSGGSGRRMAGWRCRGNSTNGGLMRRQTVKWVHTDLRGAARTGK